MSSDSGGCLDQMVIAELRALAGGGDDLLVEVLELFNADVPVQLDALSAALASGDAGSVRQIAHRLRGSALGVGARDFAAACAEVERAAGADNLSTAGDAATRLRAEFASARAALAAEVRE